MKKLISLMLCLALMLSMGGTAFADSGIRRSALQDLVDKYYGYRLPDMDSFCKGELDISYRDSMNGYVHLAYDTQLSSEALGEYTGLITKSYSFKNSIYDSSRGIYGYTRSGIDGFEPGYGYSSKVALLLVCADGYTHVYYDTDIKYSDTGERVKSQISADAVSAASKGGSGGKKEHVSLGIEIPDLNAFCRYELELYYMDTLENYVHVCYEDEPSAYELKSYMAVLEDDYGFELDILDKSRGIYGFDYFEERIWTLYPGYGFKDENDVAFLIVSDDGYTHVYYSIDFDYCDTGDRA